MVLLVTVQFVETVGSEIVPVVVWRTVCLYGQARLFLVEQHLEEHIAVIQATAVEDELQVGAHGEDAGTPPALRLQLAEVVCLEVVAIDADKANSLLGKLDLTGSEKFRQNIKDVINEIKSKAKPVRVKSNADNNVKANGKKTAKWNNK